MRQFTRIELALIQSALHREKTLLQDASNLGAINQVEEVKGLMHEIQSYLLNDYLVLTPEFLSKLRATKNAEEWSVLVKGMLVSNGGDYPTDWFEKVMASGLTAECEKNWGDAVLSSYKASSPNANASLPEGLRIDNLAPEFDTIIVTCKGTIITVSRDEDSCVHVDVMHIAVKADANNKVDTKITERHLVLGITGDLT